MTKNEYDELRNSIVEEISNLVANEIAQIKNRQLNDMLRRETILHTLFKENIITPDMFVENIEEYNTLYNALVEIMKEKSIILRINKAKEFNKNSSMKIFADDLNFISQLSESGGVTEKVRNSILELPHTSRFVKSLDEFDKEKVN